MHVDLHALIQAYGYPITFVGALFEGETILTLAGLAAHRGHLAWPALWVLAAAGGMLGDVIYFALGRRYGAGLIARWPRFVPAIERVQRLVRRNPTLAVILVRFLYGVRIAGPVVIGSSRLPWSRYLALNAIGALLWSACWLTAGYAVGMAAEQVVGNLARIERELFLAVLVGAVIVGLLLKFRERAQNSPGANPPLPPGT
ncbi:MAG TPA: DedA family protein [Casimicrobiaceae bacterium]|nr:DedA family protein [Casimicrobiaceae bacterium]